MKYLFKGKREGSHDFWISYTDLMCGFLIVFIIASIIANRDAIKTYEQLKEYEGKMVNMNKEFDDIFPEDDGYKVIDSLDCIRIYPVVEKELFKIDSDRMENNLRRRLVDDRIGKRFVQRAMKLVNEDKNISEIRIEGHADTNGDDFMHNLALSSRRAYAVFDCIRNDCGLSPQEKRFVDSLMIAVGYSNAKPVIENGRINIDKSRRVEFKIIGEGFSVK
ncbi:MAG: OmpA family protein [Paludibacteraceae bacterium]|nr:OmpA family protein [Paludibacteraceae bacterium]